MSDPLQSYVRTYRKRTGFSQNEIAFLLGCQSGAKVSRYERLVRNPNLRTVFAYEVVFRTPASVLFAGIYAKVEKETMARARLLAEKMSKAKPERTTLSKLAVLVSLANGSASPQHARR